MNTYILNVTHEFCSQGNVRVKKYINGFMPEDAIGYANKKNGKGRNITLQLSGINQEVKTDIPADKKIFRSRTPIKDFVRHHSLQQGDKVYLEKIDRRVFRLRPVTKQFTFIDLFAGIGGMRLAFDKAGGKCVFTSEWDKYAQETYEANFGEKPAGDITKIPSSEIPDHDILLAGFPCQHFSLRRLK